MRFVTQEEAHAAWSLQTGVLSPLLGRSCVTKWTQVIYGKKLSSGLLRTNRHLAILLVQYLTFFFLFCSLRCQGLNPGPHTCSALSHTHRPSSHLNKYLSFKHKA